MGCAVVKAADTEEYEVSNAGYTGRKPKNQSGNINGSSRHGHQRTGERVKKNRNKEAAGKRKKRSGKKFVNERSTPNMAATKVLVCPGNHALKDFVTNVSGFTCDNCSMKLPEGSVMYGCRSCDFDLCANCARSPYSDAYDEKPATAHEDEYAEHVTTIPTHEPATETNNIYVANMSEAPIVTTTKWNDATPWVDEYGNVVECNDAYRTSNQVVDCNEVYLNSNQVNVGYQNCEPAPETVVVAPAEICHPTVIKVAACQTVPVNMKIRQNNLGMVGSPAPRPVNTGMSGTHVSYNNCTGATPVPAVVTGPRKQHVRELEDIIVLCPDGLFRFVTRSKPFGLVKEDDIRRLELEFFVWEETDLPAFTSYSSSDLQYRSCDSSKYEQTLVKCRVNPAKKIWTNVPRKQNIMHANQNIMHANQMIETEMKRNPTTDFRKFQNVQTVNQRITRPQPVTQPVTMPMAPPCGMKMKKKVCINGRPQVITATIPCKETKKVYKTIKDGLKNDEGNYVSLGNGEGACKYYCGQRRDIPCTDGYCGPSNGNQCQSCLRFQQQFANLLL